MVESPNLAVQRVNSRVEKGGHRIDEEVIRRRYWRSMENLMNLYIPLADRWAILDNSYSELSIVAEKLMRDTSVNVYSKSTWDKFEEMKR